MHAHRSSINTMIVSKLVALADHKNNVTNVVEIQERWVT
jgi:hypothetical protein